MVIIQRSFRKFSSRVFLFRHFIHGGDTSSYSCMRDICMYSLSVSTQGYNFPSNNSGEALTGRSSSYSRVDMLVDVLNLVHGRVYDSVLEYSCVHTCVYSCVHTAVLQLYSCSPRGRVLNNRISNRMLTHC